MAAKWWALHGTGARQANHQGSLAKGADRAIHVADDKFFLLDPLGSAKSLAAALRRKNSTWSSPDCRATIRASAKPASCWRSCWACRTPPSSCRSKCEVRRLRLKRELEAGWFQWVELPLPAVLTIQSGINKVRYASLKGIMAAKKKEIVTISRESLAVPHEPTEHIERIYVPQKTKKTEFITDAQGSRCQADRETAPRSARA